MKTFRIGGIHPPQNKLTAGMPVTVLDLPRRVQLPLQQHIGRPAVPCVKVGDTVARGQMVARADGFVSAPVHASISGRVKAIGPIMNAAGYSIPAIEIEADEEAHRADDVMRKAQIEFDTRQTDRTLSERHTPEELRRIIADSGIVGLGGAAFPSTVKLSPKAGHEPELLIINACECEPYLTCDDALIRGYAPRIAEGIELMMSACGARRAVIGIEDNKPEAIAALRRALDPAWPISIAVLKTKYPQGGEKQLVEAVTGRRIPSGGLPSDVGAVVNNVATAFAVYAAVLCGRPLIERVITVTGAAPVRGNFLVAVGTSISDVLGSVPDDVKVVVGGPMMGSSAVNLQAPVTKATSGLLELAAGETRRLTPDPCIRCARCVEACPMGLEPYLLSTCGRLRMWPEAAEARVLDCIECGSCSYICPSSRPLLDYIRTAKSAVKTLNK